MKRKENGHPIVKFIIMTIMFPRNSAKNKQNYNKFELQGSVEKVYIYLIQFYRSKETIMHVIYITQKKNRHVFFSHAHKLKLYKFHFIANFAKPLTVIFSFV